jgi:hypothetical protein
MVLSCSTLDKIRQQTVSYGSSSMVSNCQTGIYVGCLVLGNNLCCKDISMVLHMILKLGYIYKELQS